MSTFAIILCNQLLSVAFSWLILSWFHKWFVFCDPVPHSYAKMLLHASYVRMRIAATRNQFFPGDNMSKTAGFKLPSLRFATRKGELNEKEN